MKFKSVHIPPGNVLVHRGEQIDAIYFIARGFVEVLTEEGVDVILGIFLALPLFSTQKEPLDNKFPLNGNITVKPA